MSAENSNCLLLSFCRCLDVCVSIILKDIIMKKVLLSVLAAMMLTVFYVSADVTVYENGFESYDAGHNLLQGTDTFIVWAPATGVSVIEDATAAKSGSKYALTDAQTKWASYLKEFNLTAGETYVWTMWTKVDGDNKGRKIKIQSTAAHVYLAPTNVAAGDGWIETSAEFTVVEGREYVQIQIIDLANTPAIAIDDIKLVKKGEGGVVDPPAVDPTASFSYDGLIMEGAEDGEVINVNLVDGIFTDPIAGDWPVANLPEGVMPTFARENDTTVSITLTGNTTGDYNDEHIFDFTVIIPAADIVDYTDSITIAEGVKLKADLPIIENFFDGFEDYNAGDSLYTLDAGFYSWNASSVCVIEDDATKAFAGDKCAVGNSDIKSFSVIKTMRLKAGETYVWSVATKQTLAGQKQMINTAAVDSVDFFYYKIDTTPAVDTWIVNTSEFTVLEGYEEVMFSIYRWKDGNTISVDNFEVKIKGTSNLDKNDILQGVSVYPNPSEGVLNISLENAVNAKIELISLSGQMVYRQMTNTNLTTINLDSSLNGVYFVKVSTENGVRTKKVVINQ